MGERDDRTLVGSSQADSRASEGHQRQSGRGNPRRITRNDESVSPRERSTNGMQGCREGVQDDRISEEATSQVANLTLMLRSHVLIVLKAGLL